MQKFTELELSPPILTALQEMGFEKMSPIQAMALPILLKDPTDFLGLAATGTGKTAAFTIPLLESLSPEKKGVQAVVLCPTRELALQVTEQINSIGKYKGFKALSIYGGSSYGTQLRGLREGASIVVGTPGRILDLLTQKSLRLQNVTHLILDEADEMISMGFKEALEEIMSHLNADGHHFWLFSATMSPEIRRVADQYLRNPKMVQVNQSQKVPSQIDQVSYMVRESNKPEILCKLIDAAEGFYGLIFCQTKNMVTELTQYLTDRGYKVDSLHGDKTQEARERTLKSFRDRKLQMLVCTDVAARGIDVKDITHVINYSLPRELDFYVHRIGRTARSGKTGIAMNLVTPSQRGLLVRLERMTGSRIREGRVPSRKEVAIKKLGETLKRFQSQTDIQRAVALLGDEWQQAFADLTTTEVAAKFLTLMSPELFIETIEEAPVQPSDRRDTPRTDRAPRQDRRERDYSRPRRSSYRGAARPGASAEGRRSGGSSSGGRKRSFDSSRSRY